MDPRVQIISIVVIALMLAVVLELVRRRRLLERYALLWLASALLLLGLAVWRGLLERISGAVGIEYSPSALFVIAFGFVLVLLLHFSVAVSRLTDQSKVLAQRIAIQDAQLRELDAKPDGEESTPVPAGEDPVAEERPFVRSGTGMDKRHER